MSKPRQNKQPDACFVLLEKLSVRSNCIIAELHRIALITPNDFTNISSSEFDKLLIDFSYFENRTSFNDFVERSEEGRHLDSKFYARFGTYLGAFGRLLDQIYHFILDFTDFTADFAIYAEQFARLKRSEELDLLSSKLLHSLGLVLLLIEQKFPDAVRERIFVALYRLRVDFELKKLETLVNLFRSRRGVYETCFTEIGLDENFVRHMINFLRFHKKGSHNGWHENALYMCLYFESAHDTLHNQLSVMRQIAESHLNGKWVLHLHLGFQVNLFEKWDRFKAASAAISSAIDPTQTATTVEEHLQAIGATSLPVGLLSLEHFESYEKTLVELNARLKWLTLHLYSSMLRNKKQVNIASSNAKRELFTYIKQIAHFEYKFKQAKTYLFNKRDECSKRLRIRLGDNFSQILAFLRNSLTLKSDRRTERIVGWLESVKMGIEELSQEQQPESADLEHRLDHLRTRVSEVLQFQISGGDQQQLLLRQFLLLAHSDLQRLQTICVLGETSETGGRIDSTYLFHFVHEHCAQMEQLLREDDALSVKFIFLKIAGSIPALIWAQMDAESRKRLSAFYYKVLELKLRTVIQAIPRAIFEEMDQLQKYFPKDSTSVFVEKICLRDFADLPRRRNLAEFTHKISKLSLGISNTCIKQLGDVNIQPRALLCDGLRRELLQRLNTIFASFKEPNVAVALRQRDTQLEQFRKTFLFVCEHVGIRDGIQIWTEQLRAVVDADVAKKYANSTNTPSVDPCVSGISQQEMLVGRIFDFMLSATRPNAHLFNKMESAWRGYESHDVKFTINFFSSLKNWMLIGLGTLVKLVTARQIQQLSKRLGKVPFEWAGALPHCDSALHSHLSSPAFGTDGPHKDLLQMLARLGQLHLLFSQLRIFVEAEAHFHLGSVDRAKRALQQQLQLNQKAVVAEDDIELLYHLAKRLYAKNAKGQQFLISTILSFSFLSRNNVSGGKKRDFLDANAVIEGAKLMLYHSSAWRRFMNARKVFAAHNNGSMNGHNDLASSLIFI